MDIVQLSAILTVAYYSGVPKDENLMPQAVIDKQAEILRLLTPPKSKSGGIVPPWTQKNG